MNAGAFRYGSANVRRNGGLVDDNKAIATPRLAMRPDRAETLIAAAAG
jgi:hypothetical protein